MNQPSGLVGREVANAEFLSALLRYGKDRSLDFLMQDTADQPFLEETLRRHSLSQKRIRLGDIHSVKRWFTAPTGRVIWQPQPPSASWAWTRHRLAPAKIALCGITHALCSPVAFASLRELVTAPIQPFDRLICTSAAVATTAQAVLDHWADVVDLKDSAHRLRLTTIPLGIDEQRHRPATRTQRDEIRFELGLSSDCHVLLFVGRLSHHAKSNPLPLFAACQKAWEVTRKEMVLLMSGWFANDLIRESFQAEAARLAPNVQIRFVDGTDPRYRDRIWHAADVFVSLADSIQETFGLTVVEAMSRGLPVIASDWNGYRESVIDQVTGHLIPTAMVRGVADDAVIEMMEARLSYDQFLGRVGQGVWVDPNATIAAIVDLINHPAKRAEMGRAGHEHVQANFTWPAIIGRFEELWEEQHFQMQRTRPLPRNRGTAANLDEVPQSAELDKAKGGELRISPPLDCLFEDYPTHWLDGKSRVQTGGELMGPLSQVIASPLASHGSKGRLPANDAHHLLNRIRVSGQAEHLQSFGASEPEFDRLQLMETLAWALKFDLLRFKSEESRPVGKPTRPGEVQANARVVGEDRITFSTTCMGRLDHLKQTLPELVKQPECQVVVVDYNCPDGTKHWVREHFDPAKVSVVEVTGRDRFDRSEAKNMGILGSSTEWVCLIDADILLSPDFVKQIQPLLRAGHSLRSSSILEGTGGTFIAEKKALLDVGMHDPTFRGWGEEDDDLLDALHFAGIRADVYPDRLVDHIDHDDERRVAFHEYNDRRISHMINRIYRAAKWDLARMANAVPSMPTRQQLYKNITGQLNQAIAKKEHVSIVIQTGKMNWVPLAAACSRELIYQVRMDDGAKVGQYATKKGKS